MAKDYPEIRPASEDPQGDPADQEQGQDIAPASQDPYGDPADQQGGFQQGGFQQPDFQNVAPASQDPYGDPADQASIATNHPDFADAAEQHFSQMPPEQFQQSAQQATAQMPPHEQQSLASTLMGALQGKGIGVAQIASQLGLGSTDPQQMGPQGLSSLLGWAQQNHPDAVAQAAQSHPSFLQNLGGPVVGGILQKLAGGFMGQRAA